MRTLIARLRRRPVGSFRLLLMFFIWCSDPAHAQQNVVEQPQCVWSFNLVGTQASPSWDNRDLGCNSWVVYAENVPATGTPSFTFQSAPTVAGAAGTFVTFAGSITTGTNPSTAQTTFLVGSGWQAWLRVTVSGAQTVKGKVFGWKKQGGGGSSGGSVTVSNFPAVQAVAQTSVCTLSSNTNVTGSGNTLIALVSGSLQIQICQITVFAENGTAIDWKLTQGTGPTCGTGTGDITPTFYGSPGGAFDLAPNVWFNTAGNSICFNQSAAVRTAVKLMYRYQ